MTKALASALVDVFTSLTGLLLAAVVVAAVFAGVAGACGIGGFTLARRRRSRG